MCQKLFDFTASVPLDQIGLNEKALTQESEAVKSYGGSRTFASLGPITHWQKPRKSAKGCRASSKPTHRSRGAVSTCSERSISRTRIFRIRPAFFPPQKNRPKSSPKIGGRQIDDTDAVSIGYRKSYGRFHSTRLITKYRLYIALRLAALDNIFARQKGLPPGHAISSS